MYMQFLGLFRYFKAFLTKIKGRVSKAHLVNKVKVEHEEFTAPYLKTDLQEPSLRPWLQGELMGEVQRFIQTQRSSHTQRAYAGDLKQFLGYIRAAGLRPDQLDVLLEYRDYLVRPTYQGGAGLVRATANRKFATIRAFLQWLQSRGKVQENPSIWVKNFRAKTESPTQGFSDLEVAKILALPNLKSASGCMHSLMLHLLFYLGLRRSELVALRLDHFGRAHVDGKEFLTVRVQGKGDKERLLPLPAKVLPALDRYLERFRLELGQEQFLFQPVRNNITKIKAKPLHTHAVYYIVRKYALMAGVEARVSPHSCRATCISNALDHSASHRSVQQLAGWSSPLMIERYDKRRTDLQQSAAHVVDY